MTGFTRTFFAVSAAGLRGLAFVPFIAADRLNALANWCDRRAVPPSTTRKPQ